MWFLAFFSFVFFFEFHWRNLKFSSSFPFDSKTPGGFLASGLFEVFAGSLTGELFFVTLALTGGFCLYVIEFSDDLNEILKDLNDDLVEEGKRKHVTYIGMRKKFNEIIRFHSEVIELSQG